MISIHDQRGAYKLSAIIAAFVIFVVGSCDNHKNIQQHPHEKKLLELEKGSHEENMLNMSPGLYLNQETGRIEYGIQLGDHKREMFQDTANTSR